MPVYQLCSMFARRSIKHISKNGSLICFFLIADRCPPVKKNPGNSYEHPDTIGLLLEKVCETPPTFIHSSRHRKLVCPEPEGKYARIGLRLPSPGPEIPKNRPSTEVEIKCLNITLFAKIRLVCTPKEGHQGPFYRGGFCHRVYAIGPEKGCCNANVRVVFSDGIIIKIDIDRDPENKVYLMVSVDITP